MRYVYFILILLAVNSCSSSRDSMVSRAYHNTTARYNGLYNANLKIAEGALKLSESQQDQYDRILPVYKYSDAQKAKSVYPLMDDALKKTSTVIQRHTMVDKNGNEKPNSEKWIDDNWNAYGKALFYKREYFEAIEVFKYVENTYKKEQGRHIASIWLAKCYLQLTLLREASDRLDYLRNKKDMDKRTRAEYEATSADYYLQVKNYSKASEHLLRAIPITRNRDEKIRFMFILAQLHQQNQEFKKAFNLYGEVIKKNPVYEMAFNARINRARCFDAQSQNSSRVKQELNKMVKDPKNKEYLDQVYYALAGIAQKEGRKQDEIDFLKKSVTASTTNNNQKALSYHELGKIHLAIPDYKLAQAYYDSCVSNLAIDHPDYPDVLTKRNSLTKLIRSLKTIETEDSLQALARLTPAQQREAIAEKIKLEEEERLRKKQEEKDQEVKQIFGTGAQQNNPALQGGSSGWYFYNTQAINFGISDFQRKWGTRKLEDDWRRSGKQTVSVSSEEEENTPGDQKSEQKETEEIDVEALAGKMLESIPTTADAIERSNNKLIEAYYNAGMIFKEQLNDANASAKMFEELLTRFPANKYKLQSYYQLYRVYLSVNNMSKSDHYKNLLLTQYPESDYAMIIKNPNYLAEKAAKKTDLELFYEETYRKYHNGQYLDVIRDKAIAEAKFPGNDLTPKFDFLKSLSIGKTQPLQKFVASLEDVIARHSNDPVKEQAQFILDYVNGLGADAAATPLPDTTKRIYTYNPDTTHALVLFFRNIGPVKSDDLKVKLSNYHSRYYSTRGLTIASQLFDHINQIIIVRGFKNKEEALLYYKGLKENDEVFGNTDPTLYQQVLVSSNNFPEFVKQKKMDEYLDFFRRFYL